VIREDRSVPDKARKDIVRQGEIGTYHCWSRCVQRAFLCGYDAVTGIDFNYRRAWMESLLEYQAGVFAIDVGSYNILSNHTHAVLRTRPDIAQAWTAEEVAWRWKKAWPHFDGNQWAREPTSQEVLELLTDPEKIAEIRENLSSLSWFMARWKEPIARACNAEMETSGHFWEARFKCRELLDEAAVLTCSMYVDLNQVKAGQASSLIDSEHSSIRRRILAAKQREAEASRLAFAREERAEVYAFPASIALGLFEDCWLSPIDQEGPLITGEATRLTPLIRIRVRKDSDGADQDPNASEPRLAVVSRREITDSAGAAAPTSEPSLAQTHETGPALAMLNTPQLEPTGTVRRRASDAPFIGVPWREYLRVLEGLVAMMVVEGVTAEETDVGSTVREDLAKTLLRWGLNPGPWMAQIQDMAVRCHHLLGHAELVESRAQQDAQRCYYGITFCREVFGSPKPTAAEFP
jgi:hypothetical protein